MTRVTLSTPTKQATRTGASVAAALAQRLPLIAFEARRVSALLAAGLHGRGRAGPGETFWQYRPFSAGEPANRIDWRRSARHDDHYFVREREWEAAHTVYLWIDRSASMNFSSDQAQVSKADRALVIGLALADLLVRSGERVALMGLTKPSASRQVIDHFAEALIADAGVASPSIPFFPMHSRAEAVVISDFLEPTADLLPRLALLASSGAKGHLVSVLDPVETQFPFTGETELVGVESIRRLDIGDADAFRSTYLDLIERHHQALQIFCSEKGWDFGLHSTERSASSALLPLISRMAAR